MRRFVIRGLLSLCLTAGSGRAAPAQSLFDEEWMAQATVPAIQGLFDQGAALSLSEEREGETDRMCRLRAGNDKSLVRIQR